MAPNSKKEIETKQVKVERKYPESLQTHFVTNIVVQHQPDFFILSFFEVFPPPILGKTLEERQAALEALDRVDAVCVARLVVSPQKMKEFAKAINDNIATHEAMLKLIAKQN